MVLVALILVVQLVLCTLAAYAFARYAFSGRNLLFVVVLLQLAPRDVQVSTLAGDPIRAVMNNAPENDRPIGGVKVVTDNGWFAARPSGTEAVYKLYAESFRDRTHLQRIQDEGEEIIQKVFTTTAPD